MPLPNLSLIELEQLVLDKCDSFVRLGIWPSSQQLNFRGWLGNYGDDVERTYALHLLNAFTYFNSELCGALAFGSVHSLSVSQSSEPRMSDALGAWEADLNRTVFVPVEGEKPNITDSGLMLAGMIRRRLGVSEEHFMPLDQLLEELASRRSQPSRVIFFDDFIGSGQQFLRLLTTPRVNRLPSDVLTAAGCEVYYCCFVATSYGLDAVKGGLPQVTVTPAHTIDQTHSVADPNSRVWPTDLKPGVDAFITDSTRRSGYPEAKRLGFHDLGLALAFEHTIPDSSLPLLWHSSATWTPLMRRA